MSEGGVECSGYFLYIFLTRFSMKAVVLNNELPALSRNNIIYQFNRVGFGLGVNGRGCMII